MIFLKFYILRYTWDRMQNFYQMEQKEKNKSNIYIFNIHFKKFVLVGKNNCEN